MPRSLPAISPELRVLAQNLGARISLARRRRKISKAIFAQRIDVSRNTLDRLEAGDPAVALGTYLKALSVLGLHMSLELVADDDPLGRRLQDSETLNGMAPPARPLSRAAGILEKLDSSRNPPPTPRPAEHRPTSAMKPGAFSSLLPSKRNKLEE